MPLQKVIKRDGSIVDFNQEKITNAILKAGEATGQFGRDVAEFLTKIVVTELYEEHDSIPVNVEVIQNKIEEVLMRKGFYQTAKAFIIYREHRRQVRDLSSAVTTKTIDEYIGEDTWEVHENANVGYSIQGLKAYLSGKAEEAYWLDRIYPKKAAELHKDGWIHIHNLSSLTAYCVGWDLEALIRRGFGGVPGRVNSGPAKHLSSLLGQMMNFLFTLQNEAAGAVAFSSFDTYLAPFVYFDKLSYKEVKQQIQEFIYNMNQTMRTGGQSPFSNITVDIVPHPNLKDRPVIVGGKEIPEVTYGMLKKEMDMINRALFEVYLEGDYNKGVFTFPIPTINITKDFDWDNPTLEPMWEATAKYGINYFANYVLSDLKPEDARSMCCRLRLVTKDLKLKGGGLFGANPLTGSTGVITINMPRIGYLSKSEDEFFATLTDVMDASKEALEIKRKTVEKYTEMGLYPYSKVYLDVIKQQTGSYWSNHFSTIGLVGMNEALLNFMGKDITTPEGQAFAIKVLKFMREKLGEYQIETGNPYNLEATPAESTSYSLALKDKKKYPDIITAGTEENPYYTNSTQLPVGFTDDPFEVLELQEELQSLYTGGTVIHFFLGEQLYNTESVKNFIKKVFYNYRVPYITTTPTFSICPKHGYIPGAHEYCPYCDEELANGEDGGDSHEGETIPPNIEFKINL